MSSIRSGAALLTVMFGAAAASAVTVPSSFAGGTAVGTVIAGQNYTLAVSGVSTLCSTCNAGGPLIFNADGTPAGPVFGGYAAFAPNGLDYDPSSGNPSAKGFAGAGFDLGSLVFSFNANGSTPFALSVGSFTSTATGTLYAYVNDTNYADNPASGFDVTVSAAPAVPEPATWALLIVGFGVTGAAMRRRRRIALA